MTSSISSFIDLFQSTLPRGERLYFMVLFIMACLFQSTLPRGERPDNIYILSNTRKFQSTLPRGERLVDVCNKMLCYGISIHAPARGATKIFIREWYKYSISIHAPARGATFSIFAVIADIVQISIHAPARGATTFG